jgi:hypothetical protein
MNSQRRSAPKGDVDHPVLLFTVHGHVRPIGGSGCRGWGPPWLPVLPDGSTCPLGKVKVRRGGWALWWRHGGSGEAKTAARGAYLTRDLSARLRRGRGWLLASSDWHAVSAFSGSVLPGPLWWGFSKRAGYRISPSVGYPGILIPDTNIGQAGSSYEESHALFLVFLSNISYVQIWSWS